MPKPLRVLLVDDHVLIRAGIRMCLEAMGTVEVVAEASDGRQALDIVRKERPDLVMMDITMPLLNGVDATTRLRQEHPGLRIIIFSSHSDEVHVLSALRAGAGGYLLKNAPVADLQTAVRLVAAGETFLSPEISRHLVSISLRGGTPHATQLEGLTSRQREILQLIAEGKSTKEIAFLLNVSVKTIETHRTQLMDRLDIHDIAGLVKFAMRTGLVTE
ncbi:DNA-binding response regulator [Verrucomicrobia bacterium LW23]|nr:DNA-binding response regulator [Verrucomicrobia bacterium LW23]